MLLAAMMFGVVFAYYALGCLRYDRAGVFRFCSPGLLQPLAAFEVELRQERWLRFGQCWPGGLEICTQELPFIHEGEAMQLAPGLPLAPLRADQIGRSWQRITDSELMSDRWRQFVDDLVLLGDDGRPLVCWTAASERHAAWWLTRLRSPVQSGSEFVRSACKAQLDAESLLADVESLRTQIQPLVYTTRLLFGLWLLLLPLAVGAMALSQRGIGDAALLGLLGLTHLVVFVPHAFFYSKVFGRYSLGGRVKLIGSLLLQAISPAEAMHTVSHLSSAVLVGWHPLAGSKVFADRFEHVASRVVRAASLPDGSALNARRDAHHDRLAAFIENSGFTKEQLLKASSQEHGCDYYCVNCESQFVAAAEVCRDCGVPGLVRW